nr:leucine--tRNA ligase, cytoplasmic [Tanacetum cinerariifolium]
MMESNDMKIPMDLGTKLLKAEDGNSVDATYYRSLIGSLSYKITGYNDSSYGINTDQGKRTTGIVFYFRKLPITWCTQKQPTVALSSCESEFMAATGAACQALWLKRLLSELTGWEEKRITLKVNNILAISLVRNPVFHGRSKNIDIRYHFIRKYVENGHINVEHGREPTDSDISLDLLKKMRKEFEYWYPLHIQVSGKDLMQNHLIFCIYNHAAIFPQKHWPRGFRCNGHLMLNSKKMSKSTKDFMTLKQAIEEFSADATRFSLADAGDGMDDAIFVVYTVRAAILRLTKERKWMEEVC